jgi:hypothetical protein
MDAVLAPVVEQQYRDALKTVRRELRQSGHTIDGRAHSRHQPRALIAQVAHHFTADDSDDADDENPSLEAPAGQPEAEVIEVRDDFVQHDQNAASYIRFGADLVPRRYRLEEPLLGTNPRKDVKDVFLDLSKHANANPLYTTTLVAEPIDEDDDFQILGQEICDGVDDNVDNECARCFEEGLKTLQAKSKMPVLERIQLAADTFAAHRFVPDLSTPKKTAGQVSPPLLASPTTSERSQTPQTFHFKDHPFSSLESLLESDMSEFQARLQAIEDIDSRCLSQSKSPLPHIKFRLPEPRQHPRFKLESPLVLREETPRNTTCSEKWPCLDLHLEDPFVDESSQTAPSSRLAVGLAMEDTSLQQNFNFAAARVEGRLLEELDAVDPSIRLKLPHVEPLDPIPEWMSCLGPHEIRRHVRKAMGHTYKVRLGSDPDMRLRWNPLPVDHNGIEPECILMRRPKPAPSVPLTEHPTSRHCIPAQGAPKILTEDYHGDLLPHIPCNTSGHVAAISPYFSSRPKQPDPFLDPPPMRPPPSEDDLSVLIRKRKADSQMINSNPARRLSRLGPHDPLTPPRRPLLMDDEDHNPGGRLLQNLMRMRAPEKVSAQPQQQQQQSLPTPIGSSERGAKDMEPTVGAAMAGALAEFETPSTPHRVVVSTSLSRAFVLFLRGFLPGVVLIDRDLSSEGPQSQSTDADIIPSPTTGIILTTMLRVRQAPIPGSKGLSQLRERIMRVALMYERLVVLVSENNPTSEAANVMSDSDASAYRDFACFAQAVRGARVVPMQVGGGPKTHASWAASTICQFAAETEVQQWLHLDEKPWGAFLRRMGMNAYASQVLVSRLEAVHGGGASQYFLSLAMEEKLRVSREILGSDVVMRRAAEALSRNPVADLQRNEEAS